MAIVTHDVKAGVVDDDQDVMFRRCGRGLGVQAVEGYGGAAWLDVHEFDHDGLQLLDVHDDHHLPRDQD